MNSEQDNFLKTLKETSKSDLKSFLDKHTIKILREVHPPRATLRLLDCRLVSKDFLDCSDFYSKTLGRWLLRREYKIYQKLTGIEGIMQDVFLPNPDIFVMEYLEGYKDLKQVESGELPFEALEQLCRTISQIHKRKVVHFDIGHDSNGDYGRETNILWNGSKICIIDFAGGISGLPDFASKIMRASDWLAAVKMCAKFFPDAAPALPIEITDFDKKILRKLRKI